MKTASRLHLRICTTPHASGMPSWVWVVLLVALLAAPWLGSVHALVHGKLPGVPISQAQAAGQADRDDGPGVRDLFGDHSQESDCRLYDQLAHADGLKSVPLLAPVLLPPVSELAWFAGEYLRRWAALYDARGPPSLA